MLCMNCGIKMTLTDEGNRRFYKCEQCGAAVLAIDGKTKVHHSYDPQFIHHISPSHVKTKYDKHGNIEYVEMFIKGEDINTILKTAKEWDTTVTRFIQLKNGILAKHEPNELE